jgi:hypothetical protein
LSDDYRAELARGFFGGILGRLLRSGWMVGVAGIEAPRFDALDVGAAGFSVVALIGGHVMGLSVDEAFG